MLGCGLSEFSVEREDTPIRSKQVTSLATKKANIEKKIAEKTFFKFIIFSPKRQLLESV